MIKHSFLLGLLFCFINVCYSKESNLFFQHVDMRTTNTTSSALSICQDAKGALWFGNEQLNMYDGRLLRSFDLTGTLNDIHNNSVQRLCSDGKEELFLISDERLYSFHIVSERFSDWNAKATDIAVAGNMLYVCYGDKLSRYSMQDKRPEVLCELGSSAGELLHLCAWKQGWLLGSTRGLYHYTSKGKAECLLSGKSITAVFVDRLQRIWVAADGEGIWMYGEDGTWVSLWDRLPVLHLLSNNVRCFNQDSNNNIWVGTYAGLVIIDEQLSSASLQTHDHNNSSSLRHNSVYAVFRDRENNMWVGSYYGGLSFFNPATANFSFCQVGDTDDGHSLKGFSFGMMTEDDHHSLYIATENGGLNILNRQTDEVRHLGPERGECPFRSTKSVWYDNDHQCLYVGSFLKGLFCYKNGKFVAVGQQKLKISTQRIILQLIPWENRLIVVTQGGLFLLDLHTQELSDLLSEEEKQQIGLSGIVRYACLDHQQRLWVSLADALPVGIDLRSRKGIKSDILCEKIGKKTVMCIAEDKHGYIYWSVVGEGILAYSPSQRRLETFSQSDGKLLSNTVFKMAVTDSKLIYFSSIGIGMIDLVTKQSSVLLSKTEYPQYSVNVDCGIYVSSSDNRVFIGGIECLFSTEISSLPEQESFPYSLFFNSLTVNNKEITPSSEGLLRQGIAYTKQLVLTHRQNNFSIGFTATNYGNASDEQFEYMLDGWDKRWIRALYPTATYSGLPVGKYVLKVRNMSHTQIAELEVVIRPPFYASIYAWCLYMLLASGLIILLVHRSRRRALLKASLLMERHERERIEKLDQEKLKFYINVSHELRTPLTLMSSSLELILRQYAGMEPALQGKLNKVWRYVMQMQQLVTEMLDIRRLEQGKMPLKAQYCNLVEWGKAVFDSFKDYAVANHIQYKWDCVESELWVWFDPKQMRKVLNNLLLNAFKFTPSGGTVRLWVKKEADCVKILVEDTGRGIPQQELGQIFNRFYQANNQEGLKWSMGTGIGLSLARDIMLLHKGDIQVKSEEGRGTCFTIILRLGENHLTAEQKKGISDAAVDAGISEPQDVVSAALPIAREAVPDLDSDRSVAATGHKILIVDDHSELLQLLQEAFSPTCRVFAATNGEQALVLAEKEQPDIIVSDVMMPGMNGMELCRRLKRQMETSHIPVVLLTARNDHETIVEGLKCGATDYIVKPFNIEVLLLKCYNIIKLMEKQQHDFRKEVEIDLNNVPGTDVDRRLLDDSVRVIKENLSNADFSIDSWCKEVAIGRTRLNSKIKALTGLTPNDFIVQIRLQHCVELLSDRSLTVAEIAWQSGFSSSSYMCKCFKERFGVTPLQYRNRHDMPHEN